eukprot:scaffold3033_cov119-Skeletonema_dohrnii-CCMP3373.AAC.3
MGGDGGTISSNRTYLRGAGKACHTADHPSNAAKRAKLEDTEQARLILTTCAISGAVLDLTPSSKQQHGNNSCSGADIVVCPYGKLYKREEALEALLRRSQQINNGSNVTDALGSHVRGMKDLHPVRFYVTTSAPSNGGNNNGNGRGTMARYTATCPITSGEIGSGNVPSFVIVRSKNPKSKDKKKNSSSDNDETDGIEFSPNVISERAIKEMGIEGLQSEYGPFEERNMIRLAPPKAGGVFEEIQRTWEARVEEERVAKMQKKKDKKRKRGSTVDVSAKKKSETKTSLPVVAAAASASIQGKKTSVADEARSNIQTKVANNSVLSSLFGGAGKKNQTEKEKRDALFTRNC